ncbi:glycosyltransferase [Chloroflexota bacterium]
MKKVLVVGFVFPFHATGSGRIPGLVKYLPEFGWQPVVLTAPLPAKDALGWEVIETPYDRPLDFWKRLFRLNPDESVRAQVNHRLGITSQNAFTRFVFTRLHEIVAYPDMERGWKSSALKAVSGLVQKGDIDAVISTSPPVTSNLIARELKARYQIPWLADFPHLWSQNNGYPYSFLRRMIDRRLEVRTLSAADALTTTSEPLAAKLRVLHKERPIYAITHGFDPEIVNVPPDKLTDKFTITYTGSFAPVFREPSWLLEALRNLIDKDVIERSRVEVRFFGNKEPWIEGEIEKYGLSGMVIQYGRIPVEDAQAKQRESQLLFNPKWNDPKEPGIHSIKILEYLAARRPILATGKYKDVVDELLEETGAGICAKSKEEMELALIKIYKEYVKKGEVAFHGDTSEMDRYSHREMARRFTQILNPL